MGLLILILNLVIETKNEHVKEESLFIIYFGLIGSIKIVQVSPKIKIKITYHIISIIGDVLNTKLKNID